jgi:phosphomannomutase
MKKLLLFDVDGTIAESGQHINYDIKRLLIDLKNNKNYSLGIVGGGKLDKILYQLGYDNYIDHYFTECGCVYHINISDKSNEEVTLDEVYVKNIRNHKLYSKINILIKKALHYISQVDYLITGNFIDLRNGIIYISLIGMVATLEERKYYLEKDKENHYRFNLLNILKEEANKLGILKELTICYGGEVGIAIYPIEYDKTQVLEYLLPEYDEIHFFGDKYEEDGNDHNLIYNEYIIGHPVDSIYDTIKHLEKILYEK